MSTHALTIGVSTVTAVHLDTNSAQAVDTLRMLRSSEALTSLVAQAQALIPETVADAVDQDFTWNQIAHCLGVSVSAARRRYAARTPDRRVPLNPD